jgi:hypothetical protein
MFCLSLQLLIRLVIIWQGEEGVTYDGTYVPLWQIQPAISEFESPYNWDHTLFSPIPGQERGIEVVICDARTQTRIRCPTSFGRHLQQSELERGKVCQASSDQQNNLMQCGRDHDEATFDLLEPPMQAEMQQSANLPAQQLTIFPLPVAL